MTFIDRLKNTALFRFLALWLSKLVIPGFEGMSVYDVARFFYQSLQRGAIAMRASSVAFNFFLAMFPAILFFFTIIPYLPIHDFQNTLMGLLRDLLPDNAFKTVESTVTDIITRKQGGLLSIGFLMALYFSTNGMNSLMEAFNLSIHIRETRKFIRQRSIALVLVLIISVMTIVAIALLTAGTGVLHYLVAAGILKSRWTFYALLTTKWIILLAFFFFAISALYYLGPARRMSFKYIFAGSVLATVMSLLTSLGFDYYVSNFSKYNALYGSIGTLIVILLWIYFNAFVLLIGFEFNASVYSAAKKTKMPLN